MKRSAALSPVIEPDATRELPRELGLADLALTQILFIVGLPWVGVAAEAGAGARRLLADRDRRCSTCRRPSSSSISIALMPLEGGLYQWAKLGFNELDRVPGRVEPVAVRDPQHVGDRACRRRSTSPTCVGPRVERADGEQARSSRSSARDLFGGLVWLGDPRALSVGKWVHKAGGVLMLVTFAALLVVPWLNLANGSLAEFHPLATAAPVVSMMSLNLLGKMGFGAFGGFEYVAIHAGECRNPVRTIGRSVVVAAPIIAVMFILGTSSVLGADSDRPDRSHRADPAGARPPDSGRSGYAARDRADHDRRSC